MYEIKLFVGDGSHFAKVDKSGLTKIREGLNDTNEANFLEVYCYDGDCVFAISRSDVEAYTYKEVYE
ncbi:hypothetical protein [Cytobacillus purgationiresistens]|uniref:Uncharacterized protein n=1 Tax=Cytobacillus purgationiresistens TaxID=863449 RepID=A0ABU0AHM9_9BACI|nr:hypothetical protein [Cytobacillus purgationiresistens]MDQ0270766.1 hypothetical protein [Cytobacillus purgationiresistens]